MSSPLFVDLYSVNRKPFKTGEFCEESGVVADSLHVSIWTCCSSEIIQ